MKKISLTRFAYLSIAAAIITIGLKSLAYLLTGSVGFLSDAMESIVNLVAAIIALFALRLAYKPPDDTHVYGHSKAEYFSSIIEGILIFVAALSIGYAAIGRLIHPQPIEQANLGIVISTLAAGVNLFVGIQLLKAGKKYNSITLEADAHHLFTDVWTSVGVIVGVFIVSMTHLNILDPIIAILVALNIVYTGYQLVKRSALGFMDTSISRDDRNKVMNILKLYENSDIKYHSLLTRQAGARKFVTVHLLFPGKWTVRKAHDFSEKIEKEIINSLENVTVTTHLEPVEDKKSYEDMELDRK